MKPSSEILKKTKGHIKSILLPTLYTVLLVAFAMLIYFYANGYRFNIFNQKIIQTGVVSVESNIMGAQLSLNGKITGKTPKSTSLEIGTYDVKVQKDAYYPWEKQINILEGKSTPIYAWLIKNNPESNTRWTSTGVLEKFWINTSNSFVLALTKESKGYSLWRYNINPALWDFSSNPLQIMQFDESNIDILLSPSGAQALLTIKETNTTQYYVIDTQNTTTLSNLKPLSIDITKGYVISWSNDNAYLILDSKSDISTYNTKTNLSYSLITKDAKTSYIWTTDENGFLYLVEPSTTSDETTKVYKIKQISLDNTSNKYIIDDFYFLKTDKYINKYRTDGFPYSEFATSPESTFSAGTITNLTINQDAQGVYIKTSLATYWYDMETQKFIMISAYPADLIAFSPDEEKLIFKDEKQFGVFTFYKVEGDPTTSIGSKTILNIKDISKISNILWISNSSYISYIEDGSIYITDKDGENKSFVNKPENYINYSVKTSRNSLITFTKNTSNQLQIIEYSIN